MNQSHTTQAVYQTDFNRALSARFAPSDKRHGLHLLSAFDAELAKIPHQTSDPLLQRIRTQFLREALYEKEGAGHWLAQDLLETFQDNQPLFSDLETLIAVHEDLHDLQASPESQWNSYCQRQSVLFKLAYAFLLDSLDTSDPLLFRQCGLAYGGALLLCVNKVQSSDESEDLKKIQHLAVSALAGAKSELQAVEPAARAAVLPLALVPPYLDLFQASDKADSQPIDLHPAKKVWILWRAARKGF